VLTQFEHHERLADYLPTRFAARFPDARDFVLQRRVLLLRANNGVEIDVALGAPQLERSARDYVKWRRPVAEVGLHVPIGQHGGRRLFQEVAAADFVEAGQ
jgi:hypothetical protein